MGSIHPIFRAAAAAGGNPIVQALRQFRVSVRAGARPDEVTVLAFTACDAITMALDMLFDGDEPMPPDGLVLAAHPVDREAASCVA